MATFDGTVNYTVTSGNTFNGTITYTVLAASTEVFDGTTDYTVLATQTGYLFFKRVGSDLVPVQLGKRRGTTIDWLSPDL